MKSLLPQRHIFKIETKRLKRYNWDLKLNVQQAQSLREIVALGDSQLFRWIANISKTNKKLEKEDKLFRDEIISVVISSNSHFKRICKKGFKVNGCTYKRLLGTTGGVKNNTVLFIKEGIRKDILKRIDNGRNLEQQLVPSKFEAYRALVASQSYPVSMPKGVVVVNDVFTHFKENVIYIDDSVGEKPLVEERENYDIELNVNDGFGLCKPSLMERWSVEIQEPTLGGVCIRNAFVKGMVFPFDIEEFAEEVAHSNMITDIWGKTYDVRDIELILTESMLKLNVGAYESVEQYLEECKKNEYDFCICKISESELDDERTLNYQYLQSFDLTDEDVEELCKPTLKFLKDSCCGDYKATLDFLGVKDKDKDKRGSLDYIEALCANEEMLKDVFVHNKVARLLKNKINEAKIGKLLVNGNYQIVSGDPYALIEGIFGLEVKGLMSKGEIYSSYWNDKNVEEVLLFRSPMTSHNNIRKGRLANREEVKKWYRHMYNIIILNSWDTICMALNGCDFDSDSLFSTNNPVLLRKYVPLPTIECVQRKANKAVVTEELLVEANINGFGNDVGVITNRVTAMFDLLANYEKGSKEYEELYYRILTGQLYQQNSIDKLKGILTKPMPKDWYSIKDCIKEEDKPLVAYRKPRFMTYIYDKEKREYTSYINGHKTKSERMFGVELEDLLTKQSKTEEEKEFIMYYNLRLPITNNNCTMHKICSYVEKYFNSENSPKEKRRGDIDITILKNPRIEYTTKEYNKIKKLYDAYKREAISVKKANALVKVDRNTDLMERKLFKQKFKIEAYRAILGSTFNNKTEEEIEKSITNEQKNKLCNIVVDLCYSTVNSKQFAWDLCREQLIKNLKGEF